MTVLFPSPKPNEVDFDSHVGSITLPVNLTKEKSSKLCLELGVSPRWSYGTLSCPHELNWFITSLDVGLVTILILGYTKVWMNGDVALIRPIQELHFCYFLWCRRHFCLDKISWCWVRCYKHNSRSNAHWPLQVERHTEEWLFLCYSRCTQAFYVPRKWCSIELISMTIWLR